MYKTSLYRIEEKALIKLKRATLGNKESELQQWIWEDPALLGEPIALLGREVVTASGARIDLLGIDINSQVCIIELKRAQTPRDVIAQALDYASWIATATWEVLDQISLEAFSQSVSERYTAYFGTSPCLDEVPEPRMIIVASSLDESSERIARFLTDRGIAINALFFSTFQDGGKQLLSSSWLMDLEDAEERTKLAVKKKASTKYPPSGYWFVNVGYKPRSWSDNRNFGFMTACGGPQVKVLANIPIGGKVFAWLNGSGYVGLGVLRSKPTPVIDFTQTNGDKLDAQQLSYPDIFKTQTDFEELEYAIGIDWSKTVDPAQAVQEWHSVMTSCALNKPETLLRLTQVFGDISTGINPGRDIGYGVSVASEPVAIKDEAFGKA